MARDTLELRLALMGRDSALSPDLLTRFGAWIRRAPEDELFRIPVLAWAQAHDVPEDRAVELFLHAAKVGILEMVWAVLCPACGMAITTPGGLRALGPDPHCKLCRLDFPATMDDQVEVIFSVEPSIRRLRYHDPEGVDPVKDAGKLFFSPSIVMGDNERQMLEAVAGGQRLLPGTRGTEWVEVPEGHLVAVVCPNIHAVCFATTSADGATQASLECLDGQFIPPRVSVAPGRVAFEITNRTDYTVTVIALDMGPHYDLGASPPSDVPRLYTLRPFLSGKQVLTNQTFRDLFRGEVVGLQGLRLRELGVVFSDLEASTALYERVGDLRALELVREHFDRVGEVVTRHHGAVVKTIGDAVMAAFAEPERAVAAAAGIVRAVGRIDADGVRMRAKVGVHAGSCIAIQTNHQIDYFGTAVNIAARVQSVAQGGEIVVTDRVWNVPGVGGLVEDFGLVETRDRVDLRGIAYGVEIHRLR